MRRDVSRLESRDIICACSTLWLKTTVVFNFLSRMKMDQGFRVMACSFRLFTAVLLLASKAEGICDSGDVRLEGGSVPNEGKVGVCIGEEWGTVCDDDFGSEDAGIVCKQLGFSKIGPVVYADSTPFGIADAATAIFMDSVGCLGNEPKLIDCDYDSNHDCYHFEDVGIHCGICDNGAVRLVNDSAGTKVVVNGQVEICWNNTWGAVCDQNWTETDTAVVCKQLGYSQYVSSYSSGQSSRPTLLQNVACTGNEERLIDCPHTGTCMRADNVGVICLSPPQTPTPVVKRISASQIRVLWVPGSQGDTSTDYIVKYYPLNSSSLQNIEVQYITTNETQLVIQGLDPFLSYSISVAASNDAGIGEYSNKVTLEVLESRFFQIFFNGSIDCKEWTMIDAEIKLEYVKSNLMSDLNSICPCDFTPELEVFYFNTPLCLPDHPQVVAVWGSVFGSDACKSVDIMKCLQDHIESGSQHSVEGVTLKPLKYCSVYLNEGSMPSCDIETPETSKEGTVSPTPYIVSMVVVTVLALLIVVGMCIVTVAVYKRMLHSRNFKSNRLGKVDESLYENSSDFPPVFSRERSADQVPKGSVGAYDKAQDVYMLQPK